MSVTETVMSALGSGSVLPRVKYVFEVEDGTRWQVRTLSLREEISGLYQCDLELTSADLDADVDALEGASCVVRIERDAQVRRLCGIVGRAEYRETMDDHLFARVQICPALAALGQQRDSRIFQQRTVKEILQEVLSEGLSPYQRSIRLDLSRDYQPREFCTQYGESNLDFALRLMSEVGIFFYFDHSEEKEELVLTDMNERCPRHEGRPLPVTGPEAPQHILQRETISRLEAGRRMRSTTSVLRDFDWMKPSIDLTSQKGGADSKGRERIVYEYPAFTVTAGAPRAQGRKESYDAGTRFGIGEGNVIGLMPGVVIEVQGQLHPKMGTTFLVTGVKHEGESVEELQLEMADAHGHRRRYWNHFTCIPFDLPYRPELIRRAALGGAQTAIVVGPPGEEVHTDAYGRIKVQFHWDRQGAEDDRSSCWIRTSQNWAGAGWGFLFLPRIGMEVVVQFLEGNPDRPLVTGCVYNGEHPTPYDLPAQKTQSGIKTSSSPGNGGSNELRFEDAAGSEEVYLHAQKDLNEVVENDHSTTVHANQANSVDLNRTKSVGVNETNAIGAMRVTTVGADEVKTIGANQIKIVGADVTKTIGGDEIRTVEGARTTSVTGKETAVFQDSREITVQVDDALTVATGTRTVEVKGLLTETYHDDRKTTVEKSDTLEVTSDKTTVVGGQYNIEAQKQFYVLQNEDQFFLGNSAYLGTVGKLQLVTEKAEINAFPDGTIEVTAEEKIRLSCGKSSITMKKDGTIEITGEKVTVGDANNNATFEPSGTSVNGVKITSTAVGIHEVMGALVKIG